MKPWREARVGFTHGDRASAGMANEAGFDTINTDEAERSEDAVSTEDFAEGFDVSEAVLQGEHDGVLVHHGSDDFFKMLIRSGLPRDDDDIDLPDLFRSSRTGDLW